MGMAHVLYIYEDGIRNNTPEIADAVGKAIMYVCLDIEAMASAGSPTARRHTAVLNCGNCVNWVAEVHSTDSKLFLWTGTTLRPLDQLSDHDVDKARALLDDHG